MSFGGGGGGGGLIAHTHNSSLPNDGGDLSITVPTRINTIPLPTYVMVMG
jgi:hypothetical protein